MPEPNGNAGTKVDEQASRLLSATERQLKAPTAEGHAVAVNNKVATPLRYVSLSGAVVFALSLVALAFLQWSHPGSSSNDAYVLAVMVCLLLAAWSSVVSLILAVCPLTRGDRRVLFWTVPLLVGWIVLLEFFDWKSLAGANLKQRADVISPTQTEPPKIGR